MFAQWCLYESIQGIGFQWKERNLSDYLHFCSEDEHISYGFGSACGWVNYILTFNHLCLSSAVIGVPVIWFDWQELSTLQCEVCILVFSLTDRRSFHRIAQLRLLLRESLPHTPIILVGNKSDLVRSREISTEGRPVFNLLYVLELQIP